MLLNSSLDVLQQQGRGELNLQDQEQACEKQEQEGDSIDKQRDRRLDGGQEQRIEE